jgi:transcriptional regulator with XRE-family HTH domain
MNKFGNRLRELRESQGLLLRQIAAQLETDTAYISKLERGERRAKREQVIQLAALLSANLDELLIFWLADQVYVLVKNEKIAKQAISLVNSELKR